MTAETDTAPTALTPNAFTWPGYSFSGWNTAANGSGTAYPDGAIYPFTTNATLYAQWTRNLYTVTFNANGGSGTMTAETDNAPTALTLNAYTLTGYSFSGWNTAANGLGTAYPDGAIYLFTTNATLYAQWTATSSPALLPALLPAFLLALPAPLSALLYALPPDGHRGLPHLWPGLGGYLGHDHRHRVLHRRWRHSDRLRYHLGLGGDLLVDNELHRHLAR